MKYDINDFFKKYYPIELYRDSDEYWKHNEIGWEYIGPNRNAIIFPSVVCADGFDMSVQGHYGAYCSPRDDFSDYYRMVEVSIDNPHNEELLKELESDYACAEFSIYGYVGIGVISHIIEKHGGYKNE